MKKYKSEDGSYTSGIKPSNEKEPYRIASTGILGGPRPTEFGNLLEIDEEGRPSGSRSDEGHSPARIHRSASAASASANGDAELWTHQSAPLPNYPQGFTSQASAADATTSSGALHSSDPPHFLPSNEVEKAGEQRPPSARSEQSASASHATEPPPQLPTSPIKGPAAAPPYPLGQHGPEPKHGPKQSKAATQGVPVKHSAEKGMQDIWTATETVEPLKLPAPKIPPPTIMDIAHGTIREWRAGKISSTAAAKRVITAVRGRPLFVSLEQLMMVLFILYMGFQLLLFKHFKPSLWCLGNYTAFGMGIGLAFSYLYYLNRKVKTQTNQLLDLHLGIKGLMYLLGNLPSWLSYTEREKVDWLNSIIREMWPYIDKAACKLIRETTDGIFEDMRKQSKVPGLKSIYFKHLTFGDAPFHIENLWVNPKGTNGLELEAGVRWIGDANITLAVEMVGGDFTRMTPRVTDVSFAGLLRIRMEPLLNDMPGFGAALVTFRKPPRVKYRLDFGRKLGGVYVAGVVKPFITHVINSTIVDMLVWPQRVVVPVVNNPEIQPQIDRMLYRNQGVLKVTVVQAKDLRPADYIGNTSDPMVQLTTNNKYKPHTKTVRKNLNPTFDQSFYLLVQEPQTQDIKVSVKDKDVFNAKHLVQLRLSNVFDATTTIGRALVPISPIAEKEPETIMSWYHLGQGDFMQDEGCGKGAGKIQLKMQYRSFENIKANEVLAADTGVVTVKVYKGINLSRAGSEEKLTAYIRIRCEGEVVVTPAVTSEKDLVWTNRNDCEFYDVKYDSDIKFKVVEKTAIAEEDIGILEIPIADIAGAKDYNPISGQEEPGFMLRTFPLEEGEGGALMVELRFVPYY